MGKDTEYIGWSREDRDLLIVLKTKMDGLEATMNSMGNTVLSRVAVVENTKLDRTEAIRLQAEQLNVNVDIEKRMRSTERTLQLLIGGLILLQIELPIALFLFNILTR